MPRSDIPNYSSYEELSKLEGKVLKPTKRGISSIIPRIYDPTGLLQPFLIKGKLILQQTWVIGQSTKRSGIGRQTTEGNKKQMVEIFK